MNSIPTGHPIVRLDPGRFRIGVRWVGALAVFLAAFLVYGTLPNRWYHVLAVTSSSMAPAIHAGDLIVVSPPTTPLEPGMILTLAVDGQLVTHRLVEVRPDGSLTTRGDASAAPDDWGKVKVEVRGIYRGRIPLLGYLAGLPVRLFGSGSTGAWFTDADQVTGRLAMSALPWASPEPAPDSGSSLGGWLDVDPFFENGRFGIQVSLCLVNAGSTRIVLDQILNTLQVNDGEDHFIDVLSEFLDFSEHPVLDPGETHCYTTRLNFYAVMDGRYHNLIQVIASEAESGEVESRSGTLSGSALPLALELSADFTLPGLDDPAPPTPLPTDTPAATPTPDPALLTPTASPTLEPTPTPTSTPLLTTAPTAQPTPEPTAGPTSEPTLEPTTEPTVEPTAEPTAEPTEEPTPEPTAEPTAEPAAEPTAPPQDPGTI